ncbi:MAG: LD-carboxypeptidase [Lachnospiraceae bacterium]|nr:LD-carboxypeptidase [Lachnospiraceae bacterium]
MKYPEFLKENGTIGFAAPSFGCAIEPYRTAFVHAQEKWKNQGYQLQLGPNCYADDGIGISSTPENCGRELTDSYCENDNDVIISCGGGELMCETLDHIDFDKIREVNPKWFMGYSDNTNFTFLLTTLCDTASIYGPCAAAFGMEPWHQAVQDAFDLLCGRNISDGKEISLQGYPLWEKESLKDEEHPLEPYQVTEPSVLHLYQGKTETDSLQIEGRLIGGCLDCLSNLVGTKFDQVAEFAERYKEDGILWFIESCDLNVMGIRRAMWQLEHAGWFHHVKGFIIGRPLCHGENLMGLDQYHAVLDIIGHYNVPVIMDADLGHIPPMVPVICGSVSRVTANRTDGNSTWHIDMQLR